MKTDQNECVRNDGYVEIDYYTDPLCCWSWALEPALKQLFFNYGSRIRLKYIMGGMIPSWESYHDPMNAVSRPLQMGPVWMHASTVSGVPIQHNIWFTDPPSSSFPACMAVKCAALQSADAERCFLEMLREAVMARGKNVSKNTVILELAEQLEQESDINFSAKTFAFDWNGSQPHDLLLEDLKLTRFYNIGRFPTLTFKNAFGSTYMIVGYRPYSALEYAFKFALNNEPVKPTVPMR